MLIYRKITSDKTHMNSVFDSCWMMVPGSCSTWTMCVGGASMAVVVVAAAAGGGGGGGGGGNTFLFNVNPVSGSR